MSSHINPEQFGGSSTSSVQIVDTPPFFLGRVADLGNYVATLLSSSNDQLSGATHRYGVVMDASKTGAIEKVGIKLDLITTGCTVDVRVETVDAADGEPSGTLWDTNTNKTIVVADTDDNIWLEVTLTANANVTKGDKFALVWSVSSGTPSNLDFDTFWDDQSSFRDYPAALKSTNGGTSWVDASSTPCLGCLYDDGTANHAPYYWPLDAVSNTSYTSASTPDHIGNVFTMPFTARLSGFWTWCWHKDGTVEVFDTDGATSIASRTMDVDDAPVNTLFDNMFCEFDAAPILNKGSSYRIVGIPGATATQYYNALTVDSANWMNGIPLSRGFMHSTTAKDPSGLGDWTDDDTKLFMLAPMFDGVQSGGAGFDSHLVVK